MSIDQHKTLSWFIVWCISIFLVLASLYGFFALLVASVLGDGPPLIGNSKRYLILVASFFQLFSGISAPSIARTKSLGVGLRVSVYSLIIFLIYVAFVLSWA